jgi:hypothetical protein
MTLSLEYVAGLFDGEGWVRVQTPGVHVDGSHWNGEQSPRVFPTYQVIAGIAITHKPLMVEIYERFSGTLHGDDHYRRKDPANRTIWRWHVSSKKAQAFLSAICPHTVLKRDQIELAIALCAHIAEHKCAMIGSSPTLAFKIEINAHRKALAERIAALKKVNFNLPVDHGATTPYHYSSGEE